MKLVLVAGTYKAATKSLFKYLADHPRISPCRIKEPGYFLPAAFGFGNRISFEKDDPGVYESLFEPRAGATHRVEATPTYLYSRDAARAIKRLYPDAQVVFCLRDPIERISSWYTMLRHLRQIPPDMTLDRYVEAQLSGSGGLTGFASRGVADGRYCEPLRMWLDEFGRERVSCVWFDDVRSRPRAVMQQLCQDLGLSPAPYERYAFEVHNPSVYLRHWWLWTRYRQLRQWLAPRVGTSIRRHSWFRALRSRIDARYAKLINRPVERAPMPAETERKLRTFYGDDVRALAALIGSTPPWIGRYR